jgi:hypothetical protein
MQMGRLGFFASPPFFSDIASSFLAAFFFRENKRGFGKI